MALSPVSPANLPLTRPQIVSIEFPKASFLAARFMSKNTADAGLSIFAAMVTIAFFITVSSSSCEDCEVSVFAAMAFIDDLAFDLPSD